VREGTVQGDVPMKCCVTNVLVAERVEGHSYVGEPERQSYEPRASSEEKEFSGGCGSCAELAMRDNRKSVNVVVGFIGI